MFNITFAILIGCSKKFEITNSSQEKIAKVAINIAGISETTILKPSNITGSSSSSSKPTNKHYNNAFAETYHKNNSGLTLDALAEQVAINSSNISTNKNNTLQNLKDNKKI